MGKQARRRGEKKVRFWNPHKKEFVYMTKHTAWHRAAKVHAENVAYYQRVLTRDLVDGRLYP